MTQPGHPIWGTSDSFRGTKNTKKARRCAVVNGRPDELYEQSNKVLGRRSEFLWRKKRG